MVLAVRAGVVRDGGLAVGTGPSRSSHEADWSESEEAVTTKWNAWGESLGKLVKGSFKKGKGKERADMGDEVDGLSRWSHGEGEKEWKREEGEVGSGTLDEMMEVRRANHKGGGDELEEESRDNFQLK